MKTLSALLVGMAFIRVCLGQERVIQFVPSYAWPGTSQLHWQPIAEKNNVLVMAEFNETNSTGLTFFGLRDGNPLLLSRYSTSNRIASVAIAASHLFVASESSTANDFGSFEILAVNDLTNPRRLGACATAAKPVALALENNLAIVAEQTSSNSGLVEIFDIAQPNNPRLLGRYETEQPVPDVEIAGDFAYLAGAGVHLLVLEITNPSNPKRAGIFQTNSGSSVRLERRGDTIHSIGTDGLHVFDVSNPRNPIRIGGIGRTIPFGDQTISVDLFQFCREYIFLGLVMPQGETGGVITDVIAQDISNPTDFKSVTLRAPGSLPSFTVLGNYAFVPQNSSWIQYEVVQLPRWKNIRRTGNTIIAEWEGDGSYSWVSATSLTNSWIERGPAHTNKLESPIARDSEFFQLRKP